MKNLVMLGLCASVIACSAGTSSSNSNTTPSSASYAINDFSVDSSVSNCNNNDPTITCNSLGETSIHMTISYRSSPGSYLIIPSGSNLPTGVTINTNGMCSAVPVSSYSCDIAITGNNVVIGSVVKIILNGSLGSKDFYTITYK